MMPATLKDAKTFSGRALPFSRKHLEPNPFLSKSFPFLPLLHRELNKHTNHVELSHILSLVPFHCLSGSRSNSTSSAWCQQSQLIKAVGAQCVIHSYS